MMLSRGLGLSKTRFEFKLNACFVRRCCARVDACPQWKALNSQKGQTVTDWCNVPGQKCSANSSLVAMDMSAFNLQCPYPAADMAVFTSLTDLNITINPKLTVQFSYTDRASKDCMCLAR